MKLKAPIEKVRLKDGILSHLEIREWEFQRMQDGIILLAHPQIRYMLGVKEDHIGWDKNQA